MNKCALKTYYVSRVILSIGELEIEAYRAQQWTPLPPLNLRDFSSEFISSTNMIVKVMLTAITGNPPNLRGFSHQTFIFYLGNFQSF